MRIRRFIDNRLPQVSLKQVLVGDDPTSLRPDIDSYRLHHNTFNAAGAEIVGNDFEVARLTVDPDTIARRTGAAVVRNRVFLKGVAAGGVGCHLVAKINAGMSHFQSKSSQ